MSTKTFVLTADRRIHTSTTLIERPICAKIARYTFFQRRSTFKGSSSWVHIASRGRYAKQDPFSSSLRFHSRRTARRHRHHRHPHRAADALAPGRTQAGEVHAV